MAAAYLYNGKGSLLLDKKAANQETLGESITLDFDLSQVDSNGLYIQLIDYAGNTTSVKIDLKVGNPGDTYAPLLYGFDTVGRYWFSAEPDTTATSLYTDTQHQFYAAEFVGGHVFAATTTQLYVMPFGQWDSPKAIAICPRAPRLSTWPMIEPAIPCMRWAATIPSIPLTSRPALPRWPALWPCRTTLS